MTLKGEPILPLFMRPYVLFFFYFIFFGGGAEFKITGLGTSGLALRAADAKLSANCTKSRSGAFDLRTTIFMNKNYRF